jgi:CheY-like chemotaxis protein
MLLRDRSLVQVQSNREAHVNRPPAVEAVCSAQTEGQPIDFVLMDIQMAGMDRHEATRILRAGGFAKAIVALRASAMKTDRESV